MHDYSSFAWAGAEQAIDEFFSGKPESVILIPDNPVRLLCGSLKREVEIAEVRAWHLSVALQVFHEPS